MPATVRKREDHRHGRNAVTHPDVATALAVYAAFESGDVATLTAVHDPQVTWVCPYPDLLAPTYEGVEAVLGYYAESSERTAGTLQAEPQSWTTDGQGHVAVVIRMQGTRPDGRALDMREVHLHTVTDGRITRVEQYVSDPAAGLAFWA